MVDTLYKPEDVCNELQSFFRQLASEFGGSYEIWKREENFGRFISAAVVDRPTGVAVTIAIQRGSRVRAFPFDASEIKRIRDHFVSRASSDLAL